MAVASRWGTWEELVLGGAVLRHGTAAWVAVAAELTARAPFPAPFTPQECEAKYQNLQEQYFGCDAWFEELRKRRVAELRRELGKSEDSIGSLQSKLESLNAERESNSSFEYNTSRTESPLPTENTDGLDSSNKEASRDGSSAGSYTGETGRDWLQECRTLASVSSQEHDTKMDLPENSRKEIGGSTGSDIVQRIFRKKRGQRKRKGCTLVKEGSVGESSMVDVDRAESPVGCDQDVRVPRENVGAPNEDSDGRVPCEDSNLVLTGIMDSIMEHKGVSIFRRRLESQKRPRYKKMIRRHVDLQNISSRISNSSISSAKELYRDLLLLANNAIVFYPKDSPEHESAITLRDLVTKALREHSRNPSSGDDGGAVPVWAGGKPMEPQSLHACSRKMLDSTMVGGKVAGAPAPEDSKKAGCRDEAPAESLARKRVIVGRTVKGDHVGGKSWRESPDKGRKRARRR